MLAPKRVKYRRMHRGHRRGKASGGTHVDFGDFALQALESCWMTNNQIEAARIAMTRKIKRGGKIWIRIFPDKSYTKKPAETRMGSGKGAPDGWVAVVKPGRILFEMKGVSEELAKEAMRLAAHKLPIATKFITRREQEAAEAAGLDEVRDGHMVGQVLHDADGSSGEAKHIAGPVNSHVGRGAVPDSDEQAIELPGEDETAARESRLGVEQDG